jgi:hypothetical protein
LSSEREFSPRYRLPAIVLVAAAAVLTWVGFFGASMRVSTPGRPPRAVDVTLSDMGANWILLAGSGLLLVYGAYRLARRDSQARGLLIVGGIGVVAYVLWEIFTIKDRVLTAVADTFPNPQAVRATLDRLVADGVLHISLSLGFYLLLIGGVLSLLGVGLVLFGARTTALVPAVAAPPPPPPADALRLAGTVELAGPATHPPGQRCPHCTAILGDETDVCWHCGRLWAPEPTAAP